MSKVFIGVGHGGSDPGAVANGLKESAVNLGMALPMKAELEKYGVIVGISRTIEENDPLAEEIKECLAFTPDVAVDCHNNAGGGEGFEAYRQTNAYAAKSLALAKAIETQVVEMGQKSRGIKTKLNASGTDYFGWLRQLTCPAVLCEGAFLDNTTDSKKIDTAAEQAAFGVAYAHGVMDYLGVDYSTAGAATEAPAADSGVYSLQVIAGSLDTVRNYAEAIGKLSVSGKPVETYIWKKS